MNKLQRSKRLLRIAAGYWRKKEKLNYLPMRLWIELSSACNLRCIMCPQSESGSIEWGLMKFGLFRKIIDEAKDFIYDINLHHRGESLLNPDLSRMIAYAQRAGLYTRLHTNAVMLDEEKARTIIKAGLNFISFSFDGFTAETYEKIRRGANFETTIDNICRFLRLKKEMKMNNPFTVFESMQLPEAKAEGYESDKEKLRKKLYSLHLDKFVVKSAHNWAGSYETENEQIAKSKKFSACTFPWFAMVILFNGKVSPCPQDFFGRLIMGDINNSSIAYIWADTRYRALRKAMKERVLSGLNPCQGCDMLSRKMLLNVPMPNLKVFFKEMFIGHR